MRCSYFVMISPSLYLFFWNLSLLCTFMLFPFLFPSMSLWYCFFHIHFLFLEPVYHKTFWIKQMFVVFLWQKFQYRCSRSVSITQHIKAPLASSTQHFKYVIHDITDLNLTLTIKAYIYHTPPLKIPLRSGLHFICLALTLFIVWYFLRCILNEVHYFFLVMLEHLTLILQDSPLIF